MGFFYDTVEKTIAPHLSAVMEETLADELAAMVAKDDFTDAVRTRTREAVGQWSSRNLKEERETRYKDVFDFFDSYVAVMFPATSDTHWSPRWYEHPAVLRRMMLMWGTFEAKVAASPATGEEEWLRTIGQFHMKWLTDRHNGPFERCRGERSVVLEPLASDRTALREKMSTRRSE